MAVEQNFSVFTPTVWADFVDVYFRKNLIATGLFTDMSANVTEGGNQIVIPAIDDNFSTNSVQTTSGNISPQTINDTATRIDIDNWEEASMRISDFQAAQLKRNYGLRKEYAIEIADRLARKVDTALIGHAGSFDNTLGDSTTQLTVTNFQQSIEILTSNSVPRSELATVIHPRAYYGDLLNKQKIYDNSVFGGATLRKGAVDNILGVDVILNNNVQVSSGALQNQMIHRKAVAYGFGNLPKVGSSASGPSGVRLQEKTGENLRITLVGDVVYGSKVWRSEAGVELLCQNNR